MDVTSVFRRFLEPMVPKEDLGDETERDGHGAD